MKVIAINGSPRKDGNTYLVLKAMADELLAEGIQTEIVQVGDKLIHGCIGCGSCRKNEQHLCVFRDDLVNEVAAKMRAADGFILGSPTYYGGVAGAMKCFLDRVFYTSVPYFANKVATSVAVARRAGALDAANQMMNFLRLAQTVTPGSQYWLGAYGAAKGEVLQDAEGMQTARKTARSMAWLIKSLNAGQVTPPADEPKLMTSFIRLKG